MKYNMKLWHALVYRSVHTALIFMELQLVWFGREIDLQHIWHMASPRALTQLIEKNGRIPEKVKIGKRWFQETIYYLKISTILKRQHPEKIEFIHSMCTQNWQYSSNHTSVCANNEIWRFFTHLLVSYIVHWDDELSKIE